MNKPIVILMSIIFLATLSCNPFSKGGKPTTELPKAQTAKNIIVEINAPKFKTMEAAIKTFIDAGFPIIYADKEIGVMTTGFSKLKTSFGGELAQRLLGTEDFELMFTIYIKTEKNRSILTILPKGRIKERTKVGVEYEDFGISGKTYERIYNLAQIIKKEAETQ